MKQKKGISYRLFLYVAVTAIVLGVLTALILKKTFLSTSSFHKYSCPTTDYIDCMPKVGVKPNQFCKTDYLQWATKNCKSFKGAAY